MITIEDGDVKLRRQHLELLGNVLAELVHLPRRKSPHAETLFTQPKRAYLQGLQGPRYQQDMKPDMSIHESIHISAPKFLKRLYGMTGQRAMILSDQRDLASPSGRAMSGLLDWAAAGA